MNLTEKYHRQRHNAYEKQYAPMFQRAIMQQIRQYPNINKDPLERVYTIMYTDIMQAEGRITWNDIVTPIAGLEPIQTKDLTDSVAEIAAPNDPDELPDYWDLLMNQYLLIYLQSRLNQVTQTTIRQIEAIPDFQLMTPTERERALRAHERVQELRANTISRTETTNAMMKAQFLTLNSSKLQGWEKKWVSFRDDRTRETHLIEDTSNQWLPLDQPFTVGTSQLMYPGDITLGATASELVNCRCHLDYRFRQGNVGFRPIR